MRVIRLHQDGQGEVLTQSFDELELAILCSSIEYLNAAARFPAHASDNSSQPEADVQFDEGIGLPTGSCPVALAADVLNYLVHGDGPSPGRGSQAAHGWPTLVHEHDEEAQQPEAYTGVDNLDGKSLQKEQGLQTQHQAQYEEDDNIEVYDGSISALDLQLNPVFQPSAFDVPSVAPDPTSSTIRHATSAWHPPFITPASAAHLLQLADRWQCATLRTAMLRALRYGSSFCCGFKRPGATSPGIQQVPQVLSLLRSALEWVGDPDGQLQALAVDCESWLAAHPARTWPTRQFDILPEALKQRILGMSVAHLTGDTAVTVLLACRQLKAGLPSGLLWASRVGQLAEALRLACNTYIYTHIASVIRSASSRCELLSPWSTDVITEVHAHALEHGSPEQALTYLLQVPLLSDMRLQEDLPHVHAALMEMNQSICQSAARHWMAMQRTPTWQALPPSAQHALQADLQQVQAAAAASGGGVGGASLIYTTYTPAKQLPAAATPLPVHTTRPRAIATPPASQLKSSGTAPRTPGTPTPTQQLPRQRAAAASRDVAAAAQHLQGPRAHPTTPPAAAETLKCKGSRASSGVSSALHNPGGGRLQQHKQLPTVAGAEAACSSTPQAHQSAPGSSTAWDLSYPRSRIPTMPGSTQPCTAAAHASSAATSWPRLGTPGTSRIPKPQVKLTELGVQRDARGVGAVRGASTSGQSNSKQSLGSRAALRPKKQGS